MSSKIHLEIEEKLLKKIDEAAKKSVRNMSSFIRYACLKHAEEVLANGE